MARSAELTAKLKKADASVKRYVAALEAQNEKLELKIAKMEVENLSLENRVKAMKATDPLEWGDHDVGRIVERINKFMEAQGYELAKRKK
jgi:hypothetical protein